MHSVLHWTLSKPFTTRYSAIYKSIHDIKNKAKGFSIGRELVSLLVAVKLLNDHCVLNYQTFCVHFYKIIYISCVTQVYMPKVCMDAG